ncbi:MAG: hypothetical protein WBB07_12145 [Mycobacterium sp.]
MKKFGFATAIATALAAGAIGLAAPSIAAPTGAGNAQDTISSLESQGYKVIVNRLSNKPLSEAAVVSVGQGPTFTHNDLNAKASKGYAGNDYQFGAKQVQTIYVNVR